MTNLHNPLPSNCGLPILCGYQNQTPTLQIIRITNIPNWYFERVVFPGEELILEALPEAVLEIYSSDEMGLFLREVLLGDWLRVNHSQYCSLKKVLCSNKDKQSPEARVGSTDVNLFSTQAAKSS